MEIHEAAAKDEGMNLVILSCDGISREAAEWEVIRKNRRM
jgi:hypothetical protein